MEERYTVPDLAPGETHETTLLIKRSRFLTHIARTSTTAEARAFVEKMRAQYADATHNCWAFVAGPPGSTAQIGASDDGEPHGTAGRPMLQILLHSGVGEICAVVTRWFGGIKLGTGGLVRAYQESVSTCLESLPTMERVPMCSALLDIGWPDCDRVRRALPTLGARITGEEFGESVTLSVILPAAEYPNFENLMASVTDGRACILPIEEEA